MPAKKRETKARKHLPRKRPTQARGEARVQRILLAAAEVVEEVGYDAATTNMIARRARCSIGSLYQFFPNKAALMHALAVQYTRELKSLLERVVTGLNTEGRSWQSVIGEIIDKFAEFHENRAGFQAVWFGGQLSPELIEIAFQCGADIARSAEPLLELVSPTMDPARRALVTRVSVEIVGAMLLNASHEKRPEFVEEAKVAVVAYLEKALDL